MTKEDKTERKEGIREEEARRTRIQNGEAEKRLKGKRREQKRHEEKKMRR